MFSITIPGSLHPNNKDVLSWYSFKFVKIISLHNDIKVVAICRNEKSLLVYASHCTVVVIDVLRMKIIHTLQRHTATITRICCSPEDEVGLPVEVRMLCASADTSGVVVVWDISEGVEQSCFSSENSTVLDLCWFLWGDASRDFLLVLHSPSNLILWNTVTGHRIWNVIYAPALSSFSVDPFYWSNITFGVTDGSILLINDVELHKAPSKKFLLLKIFNMASVTVPITQVVYSNAFPHLVFAYTQNEIACVEMECLCVIWRYVFDSSILRLMSISERDIIVTAHSNGTIAWRAGKITKDEKGKTSLHYELLFSGETQRQNLLHRIVAVALCPVTQTTIALLYSSGNISLYQLGLKEEPMLMPYRASYITDIFSYDENLFCTAVGCLKMSNIAQIFSLGHGATTVRMQPMQSVFEEGLHKMRNLAAVGSNQGIVRLVEVPAGIIFRELHIHTCPVKCLDWGGPHKLISAAHVHSLSSSLVKNDIFVTDIRTGESRRLRPEVEETPVEMLRVSFYHSYIAIGFRSEPLEIWHLKSMRLLRRMSRTCPIIVDMAWSGKHHAAKHIGKEGQPVFRENLVVLDEECHLYHVVVKGLHVRDGKEVNSQWKSGAAVKCLVWKDDLLAMGDTSGRLGVWDLGRRHCQQTRGSVRGPILKLVFSHISGDYTLAVLHQHSVVLWNSEELVVLQQYSNNCTSLSFLDIDLCGLCPLIVSSDNSFRHLSLISSEVRRSSESPLLLEVSSSQLLTEVLNDDKAVIFLHELLRVIMRNSPDNGTFHIYPLVHRLYGERWLYDLWSVVISSIQHTPLSSRLQLFWKPSYLQRRASQILACMMNLQDLSSSQTDILVQYAIILQKRDWAMQLLLGSREDCRTCALRACLLASDVSSEGAQSIIKLVATNLIANECMTDGVQMLFLIGHYDDAFRYLQSHGLWSKSFYLAKLGFNTWKDVGEKWLEHLTSSKSQKNLCCVLAANVGNWKRLSKLLSQYSKVTVVRYLLETLAAHSPCI
ncbi:unnamed protein product [Thelazia callipaeda]|uniref:WD_REPEATS_REGION domain-containing protein n=1 Tax=Thelazia callipaeda TaxID=103827 RepID=A0A158RBB7_THECL|nr:unnamed protein product [Thelazia callipaeda]